MQIETSLFIKGNQVMGNCEFETKIGDPQSVNLVALVDGEVAGYCISSMLKNYQDVYGVHTMMILV